MFPASIASPTYALRSTCAVPFHQLEGVQIRLPQDMDHLPKKGHFDQFIFPHSSLPVTVTIRIDRYVPSKIPCCPFFSLFAQRGTQRGHRCELIPDMDSIFATQLETPRDFVPSGRQNRREKKSRNSSRLVRKKQLTSRSSVDGLGNEPSN